MTTVQHEECISILGIAHDTNLKVWTRWKKGEKMRLIDVDELLNKTVELESEALEQVAKYGPLSDIHPGEWHMWDAILQERTAFKYDLMDAPRVDAVPVVRCRDCKHRDPEDHKCDCGALERAGCVFPVADDYFCSCGERRTDET